MVIYCYKKKNIIYHYGGWAGWGSGMACPPENPEALSLHVSHQQLHLQHLFCTAEGYLGFSSTVYSMVMGGWKKSVGSTEGKQLQ